MHSDGFESGRQCAQERENLLGMAAEFEQLAAALEQLSSKRRRY